VDGWALAAASVPHRREYRCGRLPLGPPRSTSIRGSAGKFEGEDRWSVPGVDARLEAMVSFRSDLAHARQIQRTERNPMKSDLIGEPEAAKGTGSIAQPVDAPLSRAAVFMVVTINSGPDSRTTIRSFCADLAGILRAVEFRDIEAGLSCVMGFGSEAWNRLFGAPRPAHLHPFREIRAGTRHAVSTPGDLLFHIRAKRMDLCFELATQIMARIGEAVSPVDEVHGFRYFDDRDLLGFVDGTENPRGNAAMEAVLTAHEDPAFTGGSYVITQKYLHDLDGWNKLSTEAQEKIIGRKKLSDIELDDSIKPTSAHNALTTIVEDGKEVKILRDNMPFGQVSQGEFGTYFIGYSRSPRTTEQMIENMFIGNPPGNYDRLLDFSRAVTGNLFFVPSATFLENITEDAASTVQPCDIAAVQPAASGSRANDGSLGIGSLKGDIPDE
jgi:porphyrinogen peroxidase